jgi:hypothetical protein
MIIQWSSALFYSSWSLFTYINHFFQKHTRVDPSAITAAGNEALSALTGLPPFWYYNVSWLRNKPVVLHVGVHICHWAVPLTAHVITHNLRGRQDHTSLARIRKQKFRVDVVLPKSHSRICQTCVHLQWLCFIVKQGLAYRKSSVILGATEGSVNTSFH